MRDEGWARKIVTEEVPGPRSKNILEKKDEYIPRGISIAHGIVADKAKGSYIKDVDGNIFIDFAGGIAVTNAGHSNPNITEAIKEQTDRFTHTQAYKVPYENYIELAKKVISITPIKGGESRCYFANSGAEAVENAVRVARHHKKAPKVIRFTDSFHGRTSLTMGLTANSTYKKGGFPDDSFITIAPFPNPEKFPGTEEECIEYSLDHLKYLIEVECSPEETAALIIEPVQGEGGYLPAPRSFLKGVRELCEEHDVAFIADEVQSGVGRTGEFWAFEHYEIKPDLVTFGKSIANGLPLSGIVGRKDIMDSVHPGGIGGTFGGNPVSCAAAIATIDEIRDNLDHAKRIGDLMMKRLSEIKESSELIEDVRGLGPMIGIVFKDSEKVEHVIELARRDGLLLLKAGSDGDVIRICGPIVSTEEKVIEEGLKIFETVLEEIS